VPIMVVGLVWIVAALLVLILPKTFHGADEAVGGGFVIALIWYVAVLHNRIKAGKAGVSMYSASSDAAAQLQNTLGAAPQ
jgi:hypothetical protein